MVRLSLCLAASTLLLLAVTPGEWWDTPNLGCFAPGSRNAAGVVGGSVFVWC